MARRTGSSSRSDAVASAIARRSLDRCRRYQLVARRLVAQRADHRPHRGEGLTAGAGDPVEGPLGSSGCWSATSCALGPARRCRSRDGRRHRAAHGRWRGVPGDGPASLLELAGVEHAQVPAGGNHGHPRRGTQQHQQIGMVALIAPLDDRQHGDAERQRRTPSPLPRRRADAPRGEQAEPGELGKAGPCAVPMTGVLVLSSRRRATASEIAMLAADPRTIAGAIVRGGDTVARATAAITRTSATSAGTTTLKNSTPRRRSTNTNVASPPATTRTTCAAGRCPVAVVSTSDNLRIAGRVVSRLALIGPRSARSTTSGSSIRPIVFRSPG